MNGSDQDILLSIVRTWNISESPEYRGFRCANCQQYKNKAWYHWVYTGGFHLPIHLCEESCEELLRENALQITKKNIHEINHAEFGKTSIYTPQSVETCKKIISSWKHDTKPMLKAFTCDYCSQDLDVDPSDNLRKGWHVWWNNEGILTEFHFHKSCGMEIGIK